MINYIKNKLQNKTTPRLYNHIISVATTAAYLARYYGYDPQKAYIAGLLHDYVKQDHLTYDMIKPEDRSDFLKQSPNVWHGYIASYQAKDIFHINDQEILEAIKYHTTSKKDLNPIGKILYIADTIEPLRNFPDIYYLQLVEPTLDLHYKKVVNHCYRYLKMKNIKIGKDTLAAYQEVNKEKNEKNNRIK